MGQLNSIVTSKIQFVKSNKDILIIGARLKYALLLFFALFTKMNKNVNYAYQYLSNTETKTKDATLKKVAFFKYLVALFQEFAKSSCVTTENVLQYLQILIK